MAELGKRKKLLYQAVKKFKRLGIHTFYACCVKAILYGRYSEGVATTINWRSLF